MASPGGQTNDLRLRLPILKESSRQNTYHPVPANWLKTKPRVELFKLRLYHNPRSVNEGISVMTRSLADASGCDLPRKTTIAQRQTEGRGKSENQA
ncbi:hypothetical protein Rcae01_01636 [Novipirellula caenicola]|uniref:Uncharacterized protein n=1 Tax=Novipirellula caenicola TaxID=1536901 RepID=A0ABP9VLV5_9BACT